MRIVSKTGTLGLCVVAVVAGLSLKYDVQFHYMFLFSLIFFMVSANGKIMVLLSSVLCILFYLACSWHSWWKYLLQIYSLCLLQFSITKRSQMIRFYPQEILLIPIFNTVCILVSRKLYLLAYGKIYELYSLHLMFAFYLSKPTDYVTHHQFNIQQLCALPTLHLCVLYLSENKQRLVPLTA